MKNFLKNNIYYILVLVLSLPSVFALFKSGFYGASDDMHIAWLFEMDRIIKNWQIPPRFVPDLSFGFGYPLFNFVFPLPFYVGEIFHLVGFNLVDSVKLVYGLSLILSSLFMYLLLKEFLSKELSLVGALIYLYTPYRATDVYSRGAIGESFTFIFIPLIVYSIIKLYKYYKNNKINWKFTSLLSISFGCLILSHNIVSYMFFPFILLLIIFIFIKKNNKVFLISGILGILFGLLISSYFWFPAIFESNLMKYETVFDYKDHFPTIKQLITPYFGYGSSVPGPYDLMSFFLGVSNIFVIVTGIILSVFYWKKFKLIEKKVIVWAILVFGICMFMMNHRSVILWEAIPFLPYFQFPWRFLTLTTFSSIFLLIPYKYLPDNKFVKVILILGLILITIVLNAKYFRPNDFLKRKDDYYLNRYIPVPNVSQEYLTLQEEYLRLPKNLQNRPQKVYPILFSDQEINYQVVKSDGLNSEINFEIGNDGVIYYNKYYFPGWIAILDGQKVNIFEGEDFAQIALNVQKGSHAVEFRFKEVWYRMIVNYLSLISLIVLLVLSNKNKYEKN